MKKFSSADAYIDCHQNWQELLTTLRSILLKNGLEETIKWGAPVYTWKGKNVVGLGAFKSYTGLWFFQGALLSDPAKVLVNAQEGKTVAMRQWRFPEGSAIDRELVDSYVLEAIENQEAGKEIKPRKKPLKIPSELQQALDSDPELADRYHAMSLSCKREYAEYISEAKREATRLRRLEKIIPMIGNGVGLNDRYR